MTETLKCAIVAAVVVIPIFVMANELDGDEFAKSGVGLALGAVMFGALTILQNQFRKKNGK